MHHRPAWFPQLGDPSHWQRRLVSDEFDASAIVVESTRDKVVSERDAWCEGLECRKRLARFAAREDQDEYGGEADGSKQRPSHRDTVRFSAVG